MSKKLKELYQKHKLIVVYLLFGIISTVASLGACALTLKFGVLIWHDENGDPTAFLDIVGSTVQWVVGVLVSFITNKKWVFVDAERGARVTMRQLGVFAGSRVLTYFLEVGINLGGIWLLEAVGYRSFSISLLGLGIEVSERVWAKIISSVVIVISNYFISKLLVFKKRTKKDEK